MAGSFSLSGFRFVRTGKEMIFPREFVTVYLAGERAQRGGRMAIWCLQRDGETLMHRGHPVEVSMPLRATRKDVFDTFRFFYSGVEGLEFLRTELDR